MSSTNKTTSRGGKGTKNETITKTQKSEKNDTSKPEKNKSGKGSGDKNHSQQTDSVRNTKIKDQEDPADKVRKIIELTECKEEDACFALHESDFDMTHAINMLLEKTEQEWFMSVKKKKNRQQSGAKTEVVESTTEDWDAPPVHTGNEKEKPRNRTSSGPPRMHGRGWRGRESRENEKNLEDSNRSEGPRRGRMSNGPSRGGGSGRGGRGGGRLGSRTFQSRDNGNRNTFSSRPVDTWNSSTANTEENWNDEFPSPIDDWYNEEYTGSLADTKVFTPSTATESKDQPAENVPQMAEVTPMVPTQPEISSTAHQMSQALEMHNQQQQQPPPPQAVNQPVQPQLPTQQSPVPMGVGTLTTSQSQYLSQLTQQTSENMKAQQSAPTVYSSSAQSFSNPVTTYNTNYSSVTNYTNIPEHTNVQQPLPARTKTQRARVPPPSKIPASAVEMPGDLNSSVGYLDVQFGALDFMSDSNSFDGVNDSKFNSNSNTAIDNVPSVPTSNLDLNTASQPSALDSFTSTPPKSTQSQSSISSALSQSQMLSNTDSIPQPSGEHMSTVSGTYAPPRSTVSGTVPPVVSATALDMNKTSDVGHTYSQPQTNSYQSYQSQKSSNSVYQSQNYNSNNYQNSSQVTSASSYVSNQPSNSYVNSNSGSYNNPSAVNSYQNNYSSTSSYQTGTTAFPSITQPGSFPSNNQSTFQQSASQSVYGGTSGLSNSSSYNVTSSNQYNNYNTSSTSSHNHKISTGKEQSYDSTTTVSSTATTTTSSVNASPALGLANNQTSTNTVATKASSSAGKNSVMNIPPGVAAPMMGTQYIMGQAGMPFYQQPMYSYEDIQLLQQRVPPHMGPYYDMGYQTPTTLATGREGSMASGAYSMSDSRFTRSDNNASPVPSTLSQQTSTQSHQAQPMLTATMPPGYAYFYNTAGMLPGGFAQYGTPAIYPQMPAATNAHGSTNLNQYPKPSTYSGYGSGYDTLSQSQDYSKSGYVGGTQTQNKAGGVGANAVTTGSSVATDLSVMYGKTHAALGKVNSYEKQGLHSGTPPPFNFAGNQSAGIAPSGTYPQMYIPTLPHQQHHSTTMMHQPLHQIDMRHQTRRMDSGNSSGQRSQSSNQAKSGAKQNYPNSYWNPA